MTLRSHFDQFVDFLQRANLSDVLNIQAIKCRVGIVVTPWFSTPLPFWAITLGLVYRLRGHSVVLIWDDLNFENNSHTNSDNNIIKLVLDALPKAIFDFKILSDIDSVMLVSDAERHQLSVLAKGNYIRKTYTSVGLENNLHQVESIERRLNKNYSSIKQLLTLEKFDHIVVPGGIWANSGLFLLGGRQVGLRVSTYDCGESRIFLGIDNVACYFFDDVKTFFELKKELPKYPVVEEQILEEAKTEIESRMMGIDSLKFQTIDMTQTKTVGEFDIYIPLSIDWDAPGLCRNQFFSSPSQWLFETVLFLMENTGARVVIRQHPYIRHIPFWNGVDGYKDLLSPLLEKHNDRLIYLESADKYNSYALLKDTKIVLPYVSTIAIEAVLIGKIVIMESNAHFSELPFIYRAKTKQHYFDAIQAALKDDFSPLDNELRRDALLYFHIFQKEHNILCDFTPQPPDFEKWVKKNLQDLACEESTQLIVNSLVQNSPVALLKYQKRIQENSRITPPKIEIESDPKQQKMVQFQIIGQKETRIGKGTVIGEHTWINIAKRDGTIRLSVGNSVLIGRRSMISVEDYCEIADFVVLGPGVLITNVDHGFDNPEIPILMQKNKSKGNLLIEENCWFGKNAAVLGGVQVGRGSIIGAGTTITEDVPPFCVVIGNPSRIVRIFDFTIGKWSKVTHKWQVERMLRQRTVPTRAEFHKILTQKGAKLKIPGIVAGGCMDL